MLLLRSYRDWKLQMQPLATRPLQRRGGIARGSRRNCMTDFPAAKMNVCMALIVMVMVMMRMTTTKAVGYACPDVKEEPYVGHTDFHHRCPYMHGLLSGDNFDLLGDFAQYLVGEVGSTHSSNCSVSSTATNRVHKRSRSLWNKMKRLSIRLSNLLQKIHRPHAKVCMYVLYVCIVCMYLFSQHAANTVEAIPGSKSP